VGSQEYQGDRVISGSGDRLVSKTDGVTDRMGFEDHCKENANLRPK
jgi:hypothetical protein